MWIVYSLGQSLAASFHAIFMKRLVHKYPFVLVGIGAPLLAIPFMILAVVVVPPERADPVFWMAMFSTGILNIAASYMMYRAAELEDVSYLAPISAFNPVMTMIASIFTLKEYPSLMGVAGVLLIVIGSYVLSKTDKTNSQASFMGLFKRRGVQLMLGTFFIWAFTPSLEKIAMLHVFPQNPAYLSLGMAIIVTTGLSIIAIRQGNNVIDHFQSNWKAYIPIGFFVFAAMMCSFAAFSQAYVGYAVAVMRTNIFFSILFARIFLGERGLRTKIWASGFMFAGILLLTL